MENLTYHNQLLVKKTIAKNNQLSILENLIKMGLSTQESRDLFVVLYSSMEHNEKNKIALVNMLNSHILNNDTRSHFIAIIGQNS